MCLMMNKIMNNNKLYDVLAQDGSSFLLKMKDEHVVYQGHFPGQPITPGVCLVQMIGEILQEKVGRMMELDTITNLKFIQPLSPVETPEVDVVFSSISFDDKGRCIVKGTVISEDTIFTKYSMIYR